MLKRQLSIVGFLFSALALPTLAQTPSPAQLGLVIATPNVVQVLDSSKHWSTIGTVDPTTHLFTVTGGGSGVSSFNTRTGAVTLTTGDVTGALGFTPYNATNPSNYVNATGAAAAAPVQSVATRTGAVTLTHTDITDWTATLTPYALLASPAFTGTPSLPTGTTGVTQTAGDSSTKLATTAFVGNAVMAGTYTLPTASTSVLGGVKVDGSSITIASGVISATPSGGTITANTTPTSGFTAGQLMMSDGSKTQVADTANVGTMFTIIPGGNPNYMNRIYPQSNGSTFEMTFLNYGGNYDLLGSNSSGTPSGTARLRVYNTYTDMANGEWGALDWATTANTLTIGAQNNGTGTLRAVNLVGSSVSLNGAATNTNGGIGTATTSSVVVGAINTGGGSGVAPVGLADVAAGSYLKSNGTSTIPAWQAFGSNVQAGLAVNAGSSGSVVLQSGSITTGDLVKWNGATGVADATAVPSTSGFISNGTKPTLTTGTCSGSSGVGGATAGTFVLSSICAAAGTIILTAMPTVTNGYSCDAEDRTTRTAGPIIESATSTTSVTFTNGSNATVAADVIQFKCTGY